MAKKGNEKIAAVLCYILVGVIWYFADDKIKQSSVVKFHTKQAINLLLLWMVMSAVFEILPLRFLWGIIHLFFLVLWVLGIINALNEKKAPIPIIGGLAQKYLTY